MAIRERQILFFDLMVLATLEERKTKTRRLNGLEDVNAYPGLLTGDSSLGPLGYKGLMSSDYYLKPTYKRQFKETPGLFHWFLGMNLDGREINPIPVKCPYGQPGDRLWVRETWRKGVTDDGLAAEYRADHDRLYLDDYPDESTDWYWLTDMPWKPSIFMPRWASRLTLEIISVKVERLQEITEAEIISEGILPWPDVGAGKDYFSAFRFLWDEINAKRGFGWNANPWVWVIEFKRLFA